MGIIRKPKWLIIFCFVPGFYYFLVCGLRIEFVKCYGRTAFLSKILSIVPGGSYMLYVTYKNNSNDTTSVRVEDNRSFPLQVWDWVSPPIAVILAIIILRMFMYESYVFPTPSMQKTILVGDYFLVSKLSYGARLPNTPLAVPFYHHTLTPFGMKAYLDWIHLPYFRLPGFEQVKRNDLVTFNFPEGDTVVLENQAPSYYDIVRYTAYSNHVDYNTAREMVWNDPNQHVVARPVDKRENYIKRCVGVPGDKLEVKDGVLFINDKPAYRPENLYTPYSFMLKPGYVLPEDKIHELEIENISNRFPGMPPDHYVALMTKKNAEILKSMGVTAYLEPFFYRKGYMQSPVQEIFPNDTSHYIWNVDNFGPVYLPKKGTTITLNDSIYPQYDRAIRVYEGNTVERKNGKFIINGKETDTYTFKMDYYWMMGDNRHNSQDSRYWGFVPEDHIVGKAWFIWMSMDSNADNLFHKIRWSRLFTSIHGKWAPHDKQFTE